MFPAEFDYQVLESLPLTNDDDVKRISLLLRNVISMRVLPYLKKRRGTDPISVANIERSIAIKRLDDDQGIVRAVSLIEKDEDSWSIFFHERVFDYFAFVIPASQTEIHISAGTPEEQKVLALSEFILRHQIEHILYPHESARQLIKSDVKFALERRQTDPTFFKVLKRAMTDEMNGIKFHDYLQLLDLARQGQPLDFVISSMLISYSELVAGFPEDRLHKEFIHYDKELKEKILGLCYRRTGDTSYSLINRATFVRKLLTLFLVMIEHDAEQAKAVFNDFKQKWGIVQLFRELDLPEINWADKDPEEIFHYFTENLGSFRGDLQVFPPEPTAQATTSKPKSVPIAMKSLADRIDEAREDPLFPVDVLTVIEKNKSNALGQSGAKYNEFIDILLGIPWGKIKKIDVSAEAFQEALESSHFGLHKPKEIISDFFANLIWRYGHFDGDAASWRGNGSAFLFVGPPGVGKTSLAVSIAENLFIPYHKISLGGMSDESELRGHGFTYEGSKPGAIVQGLIKMGVLNGMFIMDEVDKAEKFAISTLLEILDPEQNHLFHDKYVQTTIDIDLSNCHFILTANTLDNVPPPILNRCEVVVLDRYSVDEKIQIARKYLVGRIQQKYGLLDGTVSLAPKHEDYILRHLIKHHTYEAGVRQLERVIRTIFLRALRREVLSRKYKAVQINRQHIKHYLDQPRRPQQINDEDGVGEILGLGVNIEVGLGSLIPIQVTSIKGGGPRRTGYLNSIYATGNIQKIMDESRTVATTAVLNCAESLGIDVGLMKAPIHFHFMGGSTPKDGPSAGGAIALALASLLLRQPIRRDVAMTGEIDTQGRISAIGGMDIKLETAFDAGCKTIIIPMENLEQDDSLAKFKKTMNRRVQILTYGQWKSGEEEFNYKRHEAQVVGVENIVEAAEIALMKQEEIDSIASRFSDLAQFAARSMNENVGPAGSELCLPLAKDMQAAGKSQANKESYLCLMRPDIKRALLTRFPHLERGLLELDSSTDDVLSALENILTKYYEETDQAQRLVLLGSYRFLNKVKPALDRSIGKDRLIYLANNFTVQGVSINRCKALISQMYILMAQFVPEHLKSCPYLKRLKGIYVIDLGFIPEKYRLDVQRAERVLNLSIAQWLDALTPLVRHSGTQVEPQMLEASL